MIESNTISQIDSNKLDFIPLGICENIAGNYDNYLQTTMSHIIKIKKFEKNKFGTSQIPLPTPSPSRNFFETDKKILLLDLDETLIHADFFEENPENSKIKYDGIISFYTLEPINDNNNHNHNDIPDNNTTDDESKDDSCEKVLNKVGIFLRPKVREFLKEISS